MYLQDDNRPRPSTQFTLRVGILGAIVLIAFTVIFFRLWYLQVLSSEDYVEAAENNRVREVRTQAPRGEILDRNGDVLVGNRTALALQVRPDRLPKRPRKRQQAIERLAALPEAPPAKRIRREIREGQELPGSPVTLKRDVSDFLVYYLQENQADFPGVSIENVFVREYEQGTMAAHLLGHVGEVTREQLKARRFRRLEPGDVVGQEGIEARYDHVLRGRAGATRLQVDALGRPRGGPLSNRDPKPGDNLQLTLDPKVQEAGEDALAGFGGLPGAFVAMEVDTGAVLGLGSHPTFDPEVYTPPVNDSEIAALAEGEQPLTNRAIQSLRPVGSTFKAITATAALEEGVTTPETPYHDDGAYEIGTQVLRNAGNASYGTLTMAPALQVSSDVFFYHLGDLLDTTTEEGLQRWAEDLGLGGKTGIDLAGEVAGLVPSPGWRNRQFERAQDPDSPGGKDIVPEAGEFVDRAWSTGDNINLSIGQGDLQANPLQMAVAYATIANGGTVVRPHLGQQVTDVSGRTVQRIEPEPKREVEISEETRSTILDGLHAAAQEGSGTSVAVFGGFPVEMAGKTGTAEVPADGADQSWYVALAPYPNPQIVVAATIERGGFGAEAAAPAVREILSAALDVDEREIEETETGSVEAYD